MKTLTYSTITLNQLEELFDIDKVYTKEKFNDWFDAKYKTLQDDTQFLESLLNRHIGIINYYSELELISKFIAPILNRVDFTLKEKNIRDWYETSLKYESKEYTFSGRCDFVVAKGYDEPTDPYFFIQEFKQTSASFPEDQLLAELIVALKLNNSTIIKGAYIIGSLWNFVILEKIVDKKYRYYVSKKYDAMDSDDLQQIYKNLQIVKREIDESY